MPYTKLLKKLLAESEYTSKYIVEECKKRGYKIDKSYFSKLLNGKQPPPSEQLSRIFGNILNVDERLLVIEGYIDKAPKEIVEGFNAIRIMLTYTALNLFQNAFEKNLLNEAEKEMNKMPISEFIIQLIDNKESIFNISEQIFDFNIGELPNFQSAEDIMNGFSLGEPVGFDVNDNSMFPIIPKGAKVMLKFQTDYETGDILAIKFKNRNDYIIRYVFFNGEQITLKAVDKKIPIETYNIKDISILGKVNKIITEI